jgi:sporulation protein YlmC with PRC-barrel domain
MSTRIASQKLIGNPVIGITNGEMLAKVEDLQIDPKALKAAAAITSTGSVLNREIEAIPAEEVEVWGQDAILAKQPDAIVKEEELDDRDGWLSASDDIRGYEVVAEDGTRIGTLGDVVLDNEGQIMGYEMAEVVTEGRVAVANWIDVKATRSLGPDVLIVKSEYV